MEDRKITEEEFEKQREAAIKQIVELLNKYNLTINVTHTLAIIPIK